jgi:23S rRNA (adenine2503-C2)-methyltransferase
LKDLKNYTFSELLTFFKNKGFPSYSAQQIFGWIYKQGVWDFDSMTDLSKEARRFLKNNCLVSEPKLIERYKSSDKTEKFLFELEDNDTIETVLIPEAGRCTLCISSQVGCKFKCGFCSSGKSGFKRDLETAEIINQYLVVSGLTAPSKVTNIVFMGIGEPMDNFTNTLKAVEILTEPQGINFGPRRITLSTCGLIPEIKKLTNLNLNLQLSVSLHSADSGVRSELMPINKKYPLEELIKALKEFSQAAKSPVTLEYILIKGLNTKKADAQKLDQLLNGFKAKVNLIPYNGFQGKFKTPSSEEIDNFRQELKQRGVFSTLRKSRGSDIKAACGQLRANER